MLNMANSGRKHKTAPLPAGGEGAVLRLSARIFRNVLRGKWTTGCARAQWSTRASFTCDHRTELAEAIPKYPLETNRASRYRDASDPILQRLFAT
jgi:hypothetical protein